MLNLVKYTTGVDSLTVLEPLPFEPKRTFFTILNSDEKRGKHAHKECRELIIPVQGVFEFQITTMESWDSYRISSKDNLALLIEPYMWREISILSETGIYYVLASHEYNAQDYLNTPEEFREFYGKKNQNS